MRKLSRCFVLCWLWTCLVAPAYGQQPNDVYRELSLQYDSVGSLSRIYVLKKGDYYGIADSVGRLLALPDYTHIRNLDGMLMLDHLNGSSVLMDSIGNQVRSVPYKFDSAVVFDAGVVGIYGPGTQLSLIDGRGKELMKFYNWQDCPRFIPVTNYAVAWLPQGAVNYRGDTVIPLRFDCIYRGQTYCGAQAGDSLYIFDRTGMVVFSGLFDGCSFLRNGLIGIRKMGQWALMKPSGKLLSPFKYSTMGDQYPDPALGDYISVGGSECKTLVDTNGHELFQPIYNLIFPTANRWFVLHRLDGIGPELRDSVGNLILPAGSFYMDGLYAKRYIELEDIGNSGEPIAWYDMRHRKIVKYRCDADDAYYREGLPHTRKLLAGKADGPAEFTSLKNADYGYLIAEKTEITEDAVEVKMDPSPWRGPGDRLTIMEPNIPTDSRYGLSNDEGDMILPVKYFGIKALKKHVFLANDGHGYRLVTDKGNALSSEVLLGEYQEGNRVVNKDSIAFIDPETFKVSRYRAEVVPLSTWQDAFPADFVLLKQDGVYGVVSATGKLLLPFIFTAYKTDSRNRALKLYQGDKWAIVDMHGKLQHECNYTEGQATIFNSAYMVLLKGANGKWGVVNSAVHSLAGYKLDTVGELNTGNYWFLEDGKYGILDRRGYITVPAVMTDMPNHEDENTGNVSGGGKLLYDREHTTQRAEHTAIKGTPWVRSWVYLLPYGSDQGLYNSKGTKIAGYFQGFNYTNRGNFVLVRDSSGNVAVIDSDGSQIIPFRKMPEGLVITERSVLVLDSLGDSLYVIDGQTAKPEPLQLDTLQRKEVIKDCYRFSPGYNTNIRYYLPDGSPAILDVFSGNRIAYEHTKKLISDATHGQSYFIELNNNKWGCTIGGRGWMIPPEYDSLESISGQPYIVTHKDGKEGLYNTRGREVLPCVYDRFDNPRTLDNNYLTVQKDGYFTILSGTGRQLTRKWDSIGPGRPGNFFSAWLGDKKYWLNNMRDTLSPVSATDDVVGGIVVKSIWFNAQQVIQINGKMGLYDRETNKWQIPAVYQDLDYEHGDYIFGHKISGRDTETTVFDNIGRVVLNAKGWYYPELEGGYWRLNYKGIRGLTNMRGKTFVTGDYRRADRIGDDLDLFEVGNGDQLGIMDTGGILKTPMIMDEIEPIYYMDAGVAYLHGYSHGKQCLIGPDGGMRTKIEYDEIYNNGHANTMEGGIAFIVVKDNKWGVVDGSGKKLLDCKYDTIKQVYKNKIALVKDGDKWTVLNTNRGDHLNNSRYDKIGYFAFGRASFKRGEVEGWLDQSGKETFAEGK